MSLFTEYLEAVSAYEEGKKRAKMVSVSPPAKSLFTLEVEAEKLFHKLVASSFDARVRAAEQQR